MLSVETIRKVRMPIHRDGKSIRRTAKDLRMSRNTVREVVRTEETSLSERPANRLPGSSHMSATDRRAGPGH